MNINGFVEELPKRLTELLNEEGQNRIDVAKNYIVNQTRENYQEIQNACLHQNVSTNIVPMTSTMTEKTTSIL